MICRSITRTLLLCSVVAFHATYSADGTGLAPRTAALVFTATVREISGAGALMEYGMVYQEQEEAD